MIYLARKSPQRALQVASNWWGPKMLGIAQAELTVHGLDRVDFDKPHIFVMNHQSLLDIPAVFNALPVNLCFVSKKELKRIPLFGRTMSSVGMIFVDRSRPEAAIQSLKDGGALIRSGINVVAFPEGTRSKDGMIAPFKRGIFLLALEAGVPIVTLAIIGADRVMPPSSFDPVSGKVHIEIGDPITVENVTEEDINSLRAHTRDAVISLSIQGGGKGAHTEEPIQIKTPAEVSA